ncbi:MAG: hypothetical protein HS115_19750 [Spirochaetales bacterium]|nr:hypothetical protein [Spirochaetales bacterium]
MLIADFLRGLRPGAGLLEDFGRLGALSLFRRQLDLFLLEFSTLPEGTIPAYPFLEEPALMRRLADKQFFRADPGSALLPGSKVTWVAVDDVQNPLALAVLETGHEEAELGAFLSMALALHLFRRRSLPEWLLPVLRELEESQGFVLVQSEPGSGADLLQGFLVEAPGVELAHVSFSPARLSGRVQMRELFGMDAGKRLAGPGAVLPFLERSSPFLIIQEPAFLDALVQQLLAEREEQWLFFFTEFDLGALAAAGRFSGELLARCQQKFVLPPLRQLDSQVLAREIQRQLGLLMERYGRQAELSPDGLNLLLDQDWPGNLNELTLVLELAFLSCQQDGAMSAAAVQKGLALRGDSARKDELDLRSRLGQLERSLILQAHILHGGNQVHMARALRISRGSLQYKLEKMGLNDAGKQQE